MRLLGADGSERVRLGDGSEGDPKVEVIASGKRSSAFTQRCEPEVDSNPRPAHYECAALPLSYPGQLNATDNPAT